MDGRSRKRLTELRSSLRSTALPAIGPLVFLSRGLSFFPSFRAYRRLEPFRPTRASARVRSHERRPPSILSRPVWSWWSANTAMRDRPGVAGVPRGTVPAEIRTCRSTRGRALTPNPWVSLAVGGQDDGPIPVQPELMPGSSPTRPCAAVHSAGAALPGVRARIAIGVSRAGVA